MLKNQPFTGPEKDPLTKLLDLMLVEKRKILGDDGAEIDENEGVYAVEIAEKKGIEAIRAYKDWEDSVRKIGVRNAAEKQRALEKEIMMVREQLGQTDLLKLTEITQELETVKEQLNDTTQQLETVNAEREKLKEEKKELEKTATIDPLTGLHRKERAEEKIKYLIDQVDRRREGNENRRSSQSPSEENLHIIMLDIDHFKAVNDTFGHSTGDLVLQETSKVLRERLRIDGGDVIGRYGGEEFIIAIEASLENAMKVAESLRELVEKNLNENEKFPKALRKNKEEGRSGTISLGMTTYKPSMHKKTMEELKEEADGALYWSKDHGRNQITNYKANAGMEKTEADAKLEENIDAQIKGIQPA